jgi:hypothetical protein
MMVKLPAGHRSEQGAMPDAKRVGEMMKYNEELAAAGVLISLDGLHPTSEGALITFPGGKPLVTDGPFTETKEIFGGYWMINVKSREEAIEWAKKMPADDETIELRRVFDMTDFPQDVQEAADSSVVRDALEKGANA